MKAMHEEFESQDCPTEDSIESWAIQEVMGNEGGQHRTHLDYCFTCHELHQRFKNFYNTVNNEVVEFLVAKTCKMAPLVSTEEIRIKPAFKTMRPLDPTNEIIGSKIPIAFSRQLIAEHKPGSSKDRFLVSSDGTVCGRFLALRGGFTWSFQLLSPEQRFVRKVLFSMKEENTVFQSNDLGSVELVSWTGSPEDVGAVEIIPYVDNVVYSTPGICSKAELPISIELNGELTGKINVEQEEGDNGESVLHFYLSELPHQFFSQQVIIAFSDSYRRSYIEESIGRDIYLYGPDLFRDFQLWIYIR